MIQVTLPRGGIKRREKKHIFVRSDRTRKYSIDVTGPSLFHLPFPAGLAEEKKKKSFKMFQSMKDCELLDIDIF